MQVITSVTLSWDHMCITSLFKQSVLFSANLGGATGKFLDQNAQ